MWIDPNTLYDKDYQDVGYGEYQSIHQYVAEPSEVGRLKALIKAKRHVIDILVREIMEAEEQLNEITKSNRS